MIENYTTMEATRNENEKGKMDSAGSSHFEPPKVVLGFNVEPESIEIPSKDIQDDNYKSPLDLLAHVSSSIQSFLPEDLAAIIQTPQDVHSSRQQTREKALENSCSMLQKDDSASKSTAKWKCGNCPRWFRKESSLKVHLLSDCDDPKPYKCDKCPVEFESEAQLARHKMIQTGEKPYKCDYCGFTCNMKHNLKIHIENMHKK